MVGLSLSSLSFSSNLCFPLGAHEKYEIIADSSCDHNASLCVGIKHEINDFVLNADCSWNKDHRCDKQNARWPFKFCLNEYHRSLMIVFALFSFISFIRNSRWPNDKNLYVLYNNILWIDFLFLNFWIDRKILKRSEQHNEEEKTSSSKRLKLEIQRKFKLTSVNIRISVYVFWKIDFARNEMCFPNMDKNPCVRTGCAV